MFSKDDFIKMKIELLLKNQFFVKILLQERLNQKKNILHLHAHKNG